MEYDVLITDGNGPLAKETLAQGKVLLAAVEIGENIKKSAEKGYSDFLQAKIKVHEELKGDEGYKCFCGKPATHLVFFYN